MVSGVCVRMCVRSCVVFVRFVSLCLNMSMFVWDVLCDNVWFVLGAVFACVV